MSTPGPSIPASLATPLLNSFTTFLTLAIHSLLYHRTLYPPSTFLLARAYNLPVHQSRHPGVCTWISDAVSSVREQLRAGRVRRVALSVHGPPELAVLERWVFDVAAFPVLGTDAGKDRARGDRAEGIADAEEGDAVNWTDVNEALRGALRRLAHAGEALPALPTGCTFTLAVELHDDAPAPIGHPQNWIPSEPNLQPPTQAAPNQGSSLGGANTTPIRSVQAGPMFFECWVEQSGKDTHTQSPSVSKNSQSTS